MKNNKYDLIKSTRANQMLHSDDRYRSDFRNRENWLIHGTDEIREHKSFLQLVPCGSHLYFSGSISFNSLRKISHYGIAVLVGFFLGSDGLDRFIAVLNALPK